MAGDFQQQRRRGGKKSKLKKLTKVESERIKCSNRFEPLNEDNESNKISEGENMTMKEIKVGKTKKDKKQNKVRFDLVVRCKAIKGTKISHKRLNDDSTFEKDDIQLNQLSNYSMKRAAKEVRVERDLPDIDDKDRINNETKSKSKIKIKNIADKRKDKRESNDGTRRTRGEEECFRWSGWGCGGWKEDLVRRRKLRNGADTSSEDLSNLWERNRDEKRKQGWSAKLPSCEGGLEMALGLLGGNCGRFQINEWENKQRKERQSELERVREQGSGKIKRRRSSLQQQGENKGDERVRKELQERRKKDELQAEEDGAGGKRETERYDRKRDERSRKEEKEEREERREENRKGRDDGNEETVWTRGRREQRGRNRGQQQQEKEVETNLEHRRKQERKEGDGKEEGRELLQLLRMLELEVPVQKVPFLQGVGREGRLQLHTVLPPLPDTERPLRDQDGRKRTGEEGLQRGRRDRGLRRVRGFQRKEEEGGRRTEGKGKEGERREREDGERRRTEDRERESQERKETGRTDDQNLPRNSQTEEILSETMREIKSNSINGITSENKDKNNVLNFGNKNNNKCKNKPDIAIRISDPSKSIKRINDKNDKQVFYEVSEKRVFNKKDGDQERDGSDDSTGGELLAPATQVVQRGVDWDSSQPNLQEVPSVRVLAGDPSLPAEMGPDAWISRRHASPRRHVRPQVALGLNWRTPGGSEVGPEQDDRRRDREMGQVQGGGAEKARGEREGLQHEVRQDGQEEDRVQHHQTGEGGCYRGRGWSSVDVKANETESETVGSIHDNNKNKNKNENKDKTIVKDKIVADRHEKSMDKMITAVLTGKTISELRRDMSDGSSAKKPEALPEKEERKKGRKKSEVTFHCFVPECSYSCKTEVTINNHLKKYHPDQPLQPQNYYHSVIDQIGLPQAQSSQLNPAELLVVELSEADQGNMDTSANLLNQSEAREEEPSSQTQDQTQNWSSESASFLESTTAGILAEMRTPGASGGGGERGEKSKRGARGEDSEEDDENLSKKAREDKKKDLSMANTTDENIGNEMSKDMVFEEEMSKLMESVAENNEGAIKDLAQEATKWKLECLKLTGDVQDYKQRIDDIEQEMKDMKDEIKQKENRWAVEKEKMQENRALEVSDLYSKLQGLEKAMQDILLVDNGTGNKDEEIRKLKTEKYQLLQKTAQLVREKKSLEEKGERNKETQDLMKGDRATTTKMNTDLKSQVARLQAEAKNLKKQLPCKSKTCKGMDPECMYSHDRKMAERKDPKEREKPCYFFWSEARNGECFDGDFCEKGYHGNKPEGDEADRTHQFWIMKWRQMDQRKAEKEKEKDSFNVTKDNEERRRFVNGRGKETLRGRRKSASESEVEARRREGERKGETNTSVESMDTSSATDESLTRYRIPKLTMNDNKNRGEISAEESVLEAGSHLVPWRENRGAGRQENRMRTPERQRSPYRKRAKSMPRPKESPVRARSSPPDSRKNGDKRERSRQRSKERRGKNSDSRDWEQDDSRFRVDDRRSRKGERNEDRERFEERKYKEEYPKIEKRSGNARGGGSAAVLPPLMPYQGRSSGQAQMREMTELKEALRKAEEKSRKAEEKTRELERREAQRRGEGERERGRDQSRKNEGQRFLDHRRRY